MYAHVCVCLSLSFFFSFLFRYPTPENGVSVTYSFPLRRSPLSALHSLSASLRSQRTNHGTLRCHLFFSLSFSRSLKSPSLYFFFPPLSLASCSLDTNPLTHAHTELPTCVYALGARIAVVSSMLSAPKAAFIVGLPLGIPPRQWSQLFPPLSYAKGFNTFTRDQKNAFTIPTTPRHPHSYNARAIHIT